ncbi:hypothetical protein [Dietzia sp. ANT_WB102]|uniref:hypothetical protein n=1 Tax=Dietzia sp. ANT_WB102 TaxID=2597345 RepID=UPI0011F07F8E|nr:hypothetical protein [Dietzia sp. ANT_WB102]KAA0917288.1 hypothetical protein FQ137_13925 [Dietzia sp. ANT_WB102]
MPISRTLGRLAATAAILSVAGSGAVASAQLPGVPPGRSVVVVDDTTVQIAVDAPDLTAGTVGVSLQNNSATTITCSGMRGETADSMTRGGTVTTAEIVARTVDYYAKHLHTYDGVLPVNVGSGATNMGIKVGLGSVTDLIPGSLTGGLRPEFGEAGRLGELYTEARLNGLVGPVSSVSIPARSGTTLSVVLGHSSTGERPADFRPAAVFACQRGGQDYLYSGYFGEDTPSIPLGSIASAETGRFGS